MRYSIISALLLLSTVSIFGQSEIIPKGKKGQFYAYWGWNRGTYTPSDLHFSGEDYDFTLENVRSRDNQKAFSMDAYFNPAKMTIPQTNFRIGYYLKDNFSVSFGIDHMKYVVRANQEVTINGHIDAGTFYDGVYDNGQVTLYSNFLRFEHTDGLNYFNFDARRFDQLFTIGRIIKVSVFEGAGIGFVLPRTNTTLLGKPRYDEFHLSGYGLNALVGVNIQFWNSFFIQSEIKGGFINLPDIRTTESEADRASQKFFFGQFNFTLGAHFRLWEG